VNLTLLLICANEEKSGHLDEFLRINLDIFDNLIAYDDASFDSTPSRLLDSGFKVIKGEFSKFKNELMIRQELVQHAMTFFPQTDWFFILDSDELLLATREEIESLVRKAEKNDCDGISFHLVNLWKSRTQFRTDELFNKVRKVHAWRNTSELIFSRESGLHKELHPVNMKRILDQEKLAIVHLGFSSLDKIVNKFLTYRKLGQRGRMLWRLIDERGLQLADISSIREKLGSRASDWISKQPTKPTEKTRLNQYLWESRRIEKISKPVNRDKPQVTLISLIYAGVDWLEFAYGELLTLQQELQDGIADILFCANDPSDEIVEFLQSNSIPHIIFRNLNPNEHYLSRVYRAYNHAVTEASGEYCLLVNSDMAYSQGFLTRMLDRRSETALVVGQLVESGTLKPGPLAIKRNFGKNLQSFNRKKFYRFASRIKGPETKKGGLFMPLMVNREAFLNLGAFPEGNLEPDSLSNYLKGSEPIISRPGDKCISGDAAFFEKAEKNGMQHLTITHAVAYHFQEGEKRHATEGRNREIHSGIAIANDSLNGINNERVLWNVLVDLLRNTGIRVLEWNTGKVRFPIYFLRKLALLDFKPTGSPRVKLQNATYLPQISGALRNISLLQDRVDTKRLKRMQECVITQSNTVITNSIPMIDLDSTSHFIWQPLPINDLWVVTPLPESKSSMKTIFVGALDSTKGWKEVKTIIQEHPEIDFVVVSKYEADSEALSISEFPNVEVFHKLSQSDLISVMDSCELFLLGSPFETQCLAAMEAAMRNLAIIMKPTGMLGEAPNSEEFGYFAEDLAHAFESAITDYSAGLHKDSRKVLMEMHFSATEIEQEWFEILDTELKESFKPLPQSKRTLTSRIRSKLFGTKRIKLDD
jgi:glycosyltransferase involved in cell wall biosynthesis